MPPKIAKKLSVLKPVPSDVVGAGGIPNFGVYRGIPAEIDYSGLSKPYSRDRLGTFLRHKRWIYVFAETAEVIVVAAIADAGPTGTAFVMAVDRQSGAIIADTSRPGAVRPFVSVNASPAAGHASHYFGPGTAATVIGSDNKLRMKLAVHRLPYLPMISKPWIELDVALDITSHPGMTAVANLDLDEPLASATSKNAALATTGKLTVRESGETRKWSLAKGLGGFDYTSGYLPRHTSWHWAFGMGRTTDGRSIAINLSSGFVGIVGRAEENCCWLDGKLSLLDPDADISYDKQNPLSEWTVRTADRTLDLRFQPIAVHHEDLNLGLLRSYFMQPVGQFTGTLKVGNETLQLAKLAGVVEHQDVLW